MNQLTVMLNGNGPNGPHQSHQAQSQQFFTFPGQPTMNTQGAATITLDQQQAQAAQLGASHHHQQPQLVTFQSQPQAGTMMLSAGGSQAYSQGPQQGMAQQQTAGAIQYIITQPQQPTQHQILAPTQSQFGIVQNTLLAASGMGGMIPLNQQLGQSNGTIQIPTQTLMTPNGTLQPGFVTMAPNQATIQIQNPANGTTQLFHQPQQSQQAQFQLQAPSMAGNAITFTNPTGQIINGPGGQQFVLNQTITNGPQGNYLAAQSQAPPPIYQFVLPNGQILQTMQPNALNNTTLTLSPQLMHSAGNVQQQPNAITVPIQGNQAAQTMNFLTTPNLNLAPGQTTTFITQQSSGNLQQQVASHQSPSLGNQHHQNSLLLATPSSNSTQQQLILNTSPQIHQQSTNHHQQQSLLIPAVSTANSNQQQGPQNATTMVVLTQPNAAIPSAVLDHKSMQGFTSQQQNVTTRLASPKAKCSPSHARTASKLPNSSLANAGTSSDALKPNPATESTIVNVDRIAAPVGKSNLAPVDQSTQCDDNPQIFKVLEDIAEEEEESQSSERTQEDPVSTDNASPSEPERPSRPSSSSSCGSLKIAEDEVPEEEEVEQEDNENDTENNDAFSTETELDANSPNEADNETGQGEKEIQAVSSVSSDISTSKQTSGKLADDKEGYQSSYGSPCHFTDTEDEEEEEIELPNGEVIGDGEQEIKLVRKNGLTKAAFDLINNRLMGSDCGEDQTTNDSKSSFASCGAVDEVDEEELEMDDASNDSQQRFPQTPSPAGSSSSTQMEPESTTQNWAGAVKEKTIINIKGRLYNGIDLQPIRDFAKSFKLFRLSRGLTQSQVCHDLTLKTDGQSYSQSAICRFEKLDITPKSAVKIKPVLENWVRCSEEKYPKSKLSLNCESSLADAIKESSVFAKLEGLSELNGRSSEDESIHCSLSQSTVSLEPGKKRKKRTSFTPEQLDALNHFFEKTPKPSSEEMTEIAKILGSHDPKINRDVVRVWFCNKRQALKAKKPSMMDPPTPPSAPTTSEASRHPSRARERTTTSSAYSVPQPLGPIEAPKLLNANLFTSTGALTFPYPPPVSAIPLTLSTPGPNSSAAVPAMGLPSKGPNLLRSQMPATSMGMGHLKSVATPIITSFTSTNVKNSTITTFKMEASN